MAGKTGSDARNSSRRRGRGFAAMSGLIQSPVKTAGEKRGFAVMRLLTHWQEVVGPDLAEIATPVKIGYSRDGFGAVLTVLCSGANAPMLQMRLPEIRDRVNTCYGYAAVSRVAITQTAPTGFHEGQAPFAPKPKIEKPAVTEKVRQSSAALVDPIEDTGLRAALDALGQNILSRSDVKGRDRK